MVVRLVRLMLMAMVLSSVAGLVACKDVPGADGRYANHDHGDYRPP
jgi:hypothetical protein